MQREWTARPSVLLAVLLIAVLVASTCASTNTFARARSEPVVVDQEILTSRDVLELRIGERLTIAGYTPDVITVGDGDILQIVSDAQDTTGGNPVSYSVATTYAVMRSGQTEVVVTHSMCEGITGCGGPALYYRLQVRVR